jgi:hypothetical protein
VLKWVPPPDDFVKINLDGAFDVESKSGGWGVLRETLMVLSFLLQPVPPTTSRLYILNALL